MAVKLAALRNKTVLCKLDNVIGVKYQIGCHSKCVNMQTNF